MLKAYYDALSANYGALLADYNALAAQYSAYWEQRVQDAELDLLRAQMEAGPYINWVEYWNRHSGE